MTNLDLAHVIHRDRRRKLSPSQLHRLELALDAGEATQAEIAREFRVSQSYVSRLGRDRRERAAFLAGVGDAADGFTENEVVGALAETDRDRYVKALARVAHSLFDVLDACHASTEDVREEADFETWHRMLTLLEIERRARYGLATDALPPVKGA
jgi:hypothetical protein